MLRIFLSIRPDISGGRSDDFALIDFALIDFALIDSSPTAALLSFSSKYGEMLRAGSKKSLVLFVLFWVSIVFVFEAGLLLRPLIAHKGIAGKDDPSSRNFIVRQLPRVPKVVLFPRNFPIDDRDKLVQYYEDYLGRSLPFGEGDSYFLGKYLPESSEVEQSKSLPLTLRITDYEYYSYKFAVFSQSDDNTAQCSSTLYEADIKVCRHKTIDSSMHVIVENFYHSSFYKEHIQVFAKHPLEEQLRKGTVHKYWAKFGGSSVYLEQYGVHYMVSRLVYAALQERGGPTISLLLGEVYDHHWQLIPHVELVVPSNDPDESSAGAQRSQETYRVHDASSILAVPIFHKLGEAEGEFYGPEDPRMTLFKSVNGHDEPVVIFNQQHRKLTRIEEKNLDEPKVVLRRYRSMFQCFPWQVQRGKLNIDNLPTSEKISSEFEGLQSKPEKLYVRIVELRINGKSRPETQKNWTPFFSIREREKVGHDKHIYFVYRWSDIEILRCALAETDNGVSKCEFTYRANDFKAISDGPGPFRGGTALVSVNSFLKENRLGHPRVASMWSNLESSKREVWLGFARAHLNKCGCGSGSFYRPNLILLTRDYDNRFTLTHIGLYASFDIPVFGWELDDPDKLCSDRSTVSVLIPNLISLWTIASKSTHERFMIDDYLALTLSIADSNNVVLHMKGLFSELLAMDVVQDENMQIFKGKSVREARRHSNGNIDCALEQSAQFCAAFGAKYWSSLPGHNPDAS